MMLSKDLGTVKLADFGMSKKINAAERETMLNKGHTGTLRYMAPELVAKATAHYNEKADIYSSAIIIWYAPSSQIAFQLRYCSFFLVFNCLVVLGGRIRRLRC